MFLFVLFSATHTSAFRRPSLHTELPKLNCRLLCIAGRAASDHEQQLDAYGDMSFKTSSLIELAGGGGKADEFLRRVILSILHQFYYMWSSLRLWLRLYRSLSMDSEVSEPNFVCLSGASRIE